MKKLLVLTFALAMLTGCPKYQVKGVVKDSSGNPIANLQVAVKGFDISSTTNSKGEFTLEAKNLPESARIGKKILLVKGNEGTGKVAFEVQKSGTNLDVQYPVKTEITLLSVNDEHGDIDGFPKLAATVEDIRKNNKNVFLLNGGDIFSGNPIVDQAQERGKPIIDLINELNFDMYTIGNHDFDYGQAIANKRFSEMKAQIISANIVLEKRSATFHLPQPYGMLKTENDIDIAVLGLLDLGLNGLPATLPDNVKGLKFLDPIETAKQYASLRSTPVYLLLSHLGIEKDMALANEFGTSMFDGIIGAHSHTIIKQGKLVNGVVITQGGDKNRYLSQMKLTLLNDKVVGKSSELLPMKDVKESDSRIQKMVDQYNADPKLSRVIGEISVNISSKDQLGSFICDATKEALGLDIVFQNNGGIRVSKLAKGDMTLKNVYELLPFGNQIVTVDMTLSEIKELIKYSYKKHSSIDLQIGGASYVIYTKAGSFDRVEMYSLTREPLSDSKVYKVGMNDYIASTYEFPNREKGISTFIADNDALIKFLENNKIPINYKGEKRAKVIALE